MTYIYIYLLVKGLRITRAKEESVSFGSTLDPVLLIHMPLDATHGRALSKWLSRNGGCSLKLHFKPIHPGSLT